MSMPISIVVVTERMSIRWSSLMLGLAEQVLEPPLNVPCLMSFDRRRMFRRLERVRVGMSGPRLCE